MLQAKNISVTYGDAAILKNVGFTLKPQQWLMVVGPNGAGKTTLIKAVAQSVPHEGSVLFEGSELAKMPPRRRAQMVGVLMQNYHVSFSYTVQEIVQLGRYAYRTPLFGKISVEDKDCVQRALKLTGLYEKRGQSALTLSGGELQRTFLAQLFAQNPRVLLLDEPASHLDILYQKQIFDLVREWLKQPGRAVVSVVHDLSLAHSYGTHALLANQGSVVAHGPLDTVFTPDKLQEVYGMDVFAWMKNMLGQWSA